jgi:hypothetical protein
MKLRRRNLLALFAALSALAAGWGLSEFIRSA